MHFTSLLYIVFFATLASKIQHASARCCVCSILGTCNDGEFCKLNLTCGRGRCNVLGCNCDKGCRGDRHLRSIARTSLATDDASEDYFNSADANNDGRLTFDEWVAIDANKDAGKDALAVQWAKFDSAGAGYLTKAEAISRIA